MDTKMSIKNSFKWSALSEGFVKIITPILNAILARILFPEDYAPLATITMLISFCEVFVESGLKKYLIQHEFENEEETKKAYHVAFWTTMAVALFLWGLIAIFCKPISSFLGNGEIWLAVAISGSILPMYAMVGIFNASIQKRLEFKKLFWVRMLTSSIPLFVTIPLALLGGKYWSLVIGNIASIATQMIVLKIQSGYKIKAYYSFSLLKTMLSDTIWTLIDGIVIWLTAWIDSLIITRWMSEYYLGLYKNSLTMVTSLFSMVTAAVTPVLFVGLTKYQNDNEKFSSLFVRTQQILAMILMPLGVGVFLYRDLAVAILFGNKWKEAAGVVGITALTIALRTIYISICSDVYRAKGSYKIPLILQLFDLCLLIPTCIISAQHGFWALVYARAIARLVLIIPEIITMKKFLQIDIKDQFKRQLPIILATVVMGLIGYLLQQISVSMLWQFASILICVVVYFAVLLVISPSLRKDLLQTKFIKKLKKNSNE